MLKSKLALLSAVWFGAGSATGPVIVHNRNLGIVDGRGGVADFRPSLDLVRHHVGPDGRIAGEGGLGTGISFQASGARDGTEPVGRQKVQAWITSRWIERPLWDWAQAELMFTVWGQYDDPPAGPKPVQVVTINPFGIWVYPRWSSWGDPDFSPVATIGGDGVIRAVDVQFQHDRHWHSVKDDLLGGPHADEHAAASRRDPGVCRIQERAEDALFRRWRDERRRP